MRCLIITNKIYVIGKIWMPAITCAQEKILSDYDMSHISDIKNRESVLDWLYTHSGDFQNIIDFKADFTILNEDKKLEDIVHEWSDPDSEYVYLDRMYPDDPMYDEDEDNED